MSREQLIPMTAIKNDLLVLLLSTRYLVAADPVAQEVGD